SLMLKVADLEASVKFFGQVFGVVVVAGAERWFRVGSSQLRMRQTVTGEAAAVEHIQIKVERFSAEVTARLAMAGATGIRKISDRELEIADPDGYRIRIVSV